MKSNLRSHKIETSLSPSEKNWRRKPSTFIDSSDPLSLPRTEPTMSISGANPCLRPSYNKYNIGQKISKSSLAELVTRLLEGSFHGFVEPFQLQICFNFYFFLNSILQAKICFMLVAYYILGSALAVKLWILYLLALKFRFSTSGHTRVRFLFLVMVPVIIGFFFVVVCFFVIA